MLAFLLPNISTAQNNVFESFEDNCRNRGNAFFEGCFSDWISVSGTPDVSSTWSVLPLPGPPVTAFDGRRYVRMYTGIDPDCDESTIGESIAINYNFRAGQEYTISYALRWDQNPFFPTPMQTQIVLTNGRDNQAGTHNSCDPGESLPDLEPGDNVIMTHPMGGVQNNWQTFTLSITPSRNFSQLWIRPEMLGDRDRAAVGFVYFDAFEIETCVTNGLTTNFRLAAQSDLNGNVTVNTLAFSNPGFVNHWWDVYYADQITGAPTGNDQVPGNPLQCCLSLEAEFSNNLEVNVWYYIKHGIWNQCVRWRETRKSFRVQVRRLSSGEQTYYIEFKDTKFEPSEAYLDKMHAMVSNLSSEELIQQNQSELNFAVEPTSPFNTITNYPNPFNGSTTIEFNLEQAQQVSLRVYDLTGRVIATLLGNEQQSKGRNQVIFDGSNLSEGIYLYSIESNGYKETKRMILSK